MTRLSKTTMLARATFQHRFGTQTYTVVSMLERGFSTSAIVRKTKLPKTTVATYRSNWTRGVYESFTKTCLFESAWSSTAYMVVKAFRLGLDTKEIASDLGLPTTSVATYRANFTRGTYADMA